MLGTFQRGVCPISIAPCRNLKQLFLDLHQAP
jgi:hypothetical protein